jgi:hypothetical protein
VNGKRDRREEERRGAEEEEKEQNKKKEKIPVKSKMPTRIRHQAVVDKAEQGRKDPLSINIERRSLLPGG